MTAQSQISLTPGFFYNRTAFGEDVNGFGAIWELEYIRRKDLFFGLELRTKYGYYSFDDGTNWRVDKEGTLILPKNRGEVRPEYSLFSPQVGLVLKFHVYLDELFSLFPENELSVGLMSGNFKYKGTSQKKRFTEASFSYNMGVGVEYELKKCIFVGYSGYSTLNFRNKIKKHQLSHHQEYIPNQDAVIRINIIFKVSILFYSYD